MNTGKSKLWQMLSGRAVVPIWMALATFGLTELFSRYPEITERFHSQTLYPVFASCLSFISQFVFFSLDDAFYASLVFFLLTIFLMTLFRRIKVSRFLLLLVQTIAVCYVLFYLLWGFNYFRTGINTRLQIAKSEPDTVLFTRVFQKLISETNRSYCSFDSISKPEICALVESSYQKNASFLKLDYPQGTRTPKPITLSNFFAKASIAGYYGPFFNEAHLNNNLLMVEYPQVLAHEFAHQFGITSEAEANFFGWLVCSKSNSKHLRYSANLNMLSYFMSQSRQLSNFSGMVNQISKPVIDDMRKIQDHWAKLRNKKIDRVAGKVNDVYLKTNKLRNGIEDYFGVVQFVMDFETDTLAQKRMNL